MNDKLIIAGKSYNSRLLVGTGKYKDFTETKAAVEASGAEIITIAIRRSNIGQNPDEPSLLEILPPSKYTLLPNTRTSPRPRRRSRPVVQKSSPSRFAAA